MERKEFLDRVDQAFQISPVVGLLGPRQCGKTTLAKQFIQRFPRILFLDLENPTHLARLENPLLALDKSFDLIVIDEIQRRPELFPIIRVLVDRRQRNQKFLILGSASKELIKQSSETLAGRIIYIELTPFSLSEASEKEKLWVQGGFPLSYLATDSMQSFEWRKGYVFTFLERDIPSLGINIPAIQLRRFWMMLAHYHGNILNASELGNSLGISHTAVRNYLDILTGTFMIRQLTPWHENISKRQVKSSKIYFRDSGLFHCLLGLENKDQIENHPKLGASWEGFALEEIIRAFKCAPEECFFWAIHAQAELDLLLFHQGKRLGFEVKFTDQPKINRSMRQAVEFLKLDKLFVVYPGSESFLLDPNIIALPLSGDLFEKSQAF